MTNLVHFLVTRLLRPFSSLAKLGFLPDIGSLNIDGFLVIQGSLLSNRVLQDYGSLHRFGFLFNFGPL